MKRSAEEQARQLRAELRAAALGEFAQALCAALQRPAAGDTTRQRYQVVQRLRWARQDAGAALGLVEMPSVH